MQPTKSSRNDGLRGETGICWLRKGQGEGGPKKIKSLKEPPFIKVPQSSIAGGTSEMVRERRFEETRGRSLTVKNWDVIPDCPLSRESRFQRKYPLGGSQVLDVRRAITQTFRSNHKLKRGKY